MRPMLASPAKEIKFPVYASPKIDGIRAYVKDGQLLSRSGKLIPNAHVQITLGKGVMNGLDGELCVGPPNAKDLMQKTTSGVMSYQGIPQFTYHVFDVWSSRRPFHDRYSMLTHENIMDHRYPYELYKNGTLVFLKQELIKDEYTLNAYEDSCLQQGYEGIMIRDPNGMYKFGRATAKGGELLKVKRWADSEARIIGVKQFMHNANELQQNEFGLAKRSSHQDNKVPMDMLGSFICEDIKTGQEVDVGTGYTMNQRKEFWTRRGHFVGKIVKYKHFEASGVKDAPRFPVFIGFRHPEDMS